MSTPKVTELVRHGSPHVHPVRFAGLAFPAVAAIRAFQFYAKHPAG